MYNINLPVHLYLVCSISLLFCVMYMPSHLPCTLNLYLKKDLKVHVEPPIQLLNKKKFKKIGNDTKESNLYLINWST